MFSAKQARDTAAKMIGHRITTKQTGVKGQQVNKVMVCERLYARREYYFAILLDRKYAVSICKGISSCNHYFD